MSFERRGRDAAPGDRAPGAAAPQVPGKRTRVEEAAPGQGTPVPGPGRSAPSAWGAHAAAVPKVPTDSRRTLEALFGTVGAPVRSGAAAERVVGRTGGDRDEPPATPMAFPHAASIQAATGTAIPGAAIHDAAACAQRGVPAFTDDDVTTFASATPPLEVAAHEAAHQLQHAGVTRDAGLGPEVHAQQVAHAIATAGDARGLIGDRGSPVAPGLRTYIEMDAADQHLCFRDPRALGEVARVAETWEMVSSKTERRVLFATPARIAASNRVLEGKASALRLRAGDERLEWTNAPAKPPLVAVRPEWQDPDRGDERYTDCGRMARDIQGPSGRDPQAVGVYRAGGHSEASSLTGYVTTTSTPTQEPADLRREILADVDQGCREGATYGERSAEERSQLDSIHGLNRHAAPAVGESYVSCRDDAKTTRGFNHHWGAVIMVSSADDDRVTLENHAKLGTNYASKDAQWYFDMYGPVQNDGQTWHDRWAEGHGRGGVGVGEPGSQGMTLVAMTAPSGRYAGLPEQPQGERATHVFASQLGQQQEGPAPTSVRVPTGAPLEQHAAPPLAGVAGHGDNRSSLALLRLLDEALQRGAASDAAGARRVQQPLQPSDDAATPSDAMQIIGDDVDLTEIQQMLRAHVPDASGRQDLMNSAPSATHPPASRNDQVPVGDTGAPVALPPPLLGAGGPPVPAIHPSWFRTGPLAGAKRPLERQVTAPPPAAGEDQAAGERQASGEGRHEKRRKST